VSLGTPAGKIGFARGSGDIEMGLLGFVGTSGADRYCLELKNNSGSGELRLTQGSSSTPVGITFCTNNGTLAERVRIKSNGTFKASEDVLVSNETKGIVLKDGNSTPKYWRLTVSTSGSLVITDIGTTEP
jgi:hypothetical protein